MMHPIIEATDLGRHYGSKMALEHVSFQLPAGVIAGLIGPNGAGKTTAMKLFTGLIRPTSGRVAIAGHDVQAQRIEAMARLGYVPDTPFTYGFLTPVEFIRLTAALYGMAPADVDERIEELLTAFQLTEVCHTQITGLSFGTQRKVAISAALIHRPQLLLLDEPFNGLDPQSVHSLKELLRAVRDQGTTVLVSTHLMDLAQTLCDSMLLLHQGRLHSHVQVEEALSGHRSLEAYFLHATGQGDGL